MNTIDAKLLARMFLAGAKNLEVKKEWINELNVFPVPDGDTGTNMTLTIMSAVKEVNNLEDVQMTSWQRLFPQDLYVVQEETPVLFFLSFFVDLPKESVIWRNWMLWHWHVP